MWKSSRAPLRKGRKEEEEEGEEQQQKQEEKGPLAAATRKTDVVAVVWPLDARCLKDE